ncbi:MAG: cell division protein ZapA [Eubacteriales bacterium]
MENKNKVIAKIQDIEYTLIGSVDQKHVDEISEILNDMIIKVKKSNPFMNKTMTFILTCLNLSDEITQLREKNEALELKLERIDDIEDLKEQLATYKKYNQQNNELVQTLREEQESLKKESENYKEMIEQSQRKTKQYQYDLEESRKVILDLQNQLFESQIELVKANKKSV